MPLNNPLAGYDWAAEYTVSGLPWVTSSTTSGVKEYRFGDDSLSGALANEQWLSKWVMVNNTSLSGSLQVAFTQRGFSTSNYFTVGAQQSVSLDVRISRIWVSGSAEVPHEIVVGLTGILAKSVPRLSSSTGHPGVG